MNKKEIKKNIVEFLSESNKIEREYSDQALEDAIEAWKYLKDLDIIDKEDILIVHKLLCKNIDPKIAGKWRNCDVFIGGNRKIFISEALIKEDVSKFCELVNLTVDDDLEISEKSYKEDVVKQCHIRFEDIHPFIDGNGRTGRLIMLWQRMKLKLPIIIIHADFHSDMKNGEQANYYKWFKK